MHRHPPGPLVYRQRLLTRLTHWMWAASLFFLLLTGLQIFNAHPALYWGQESGFDYNNALLALSGRETEDGLRGITWVLGQEFDTTGTLGASQGQVRGFPAWATIPSHHDLGTGRVIHFFFAWVLFGTLLLIQAYRMRVPAIVQARMVINAMVDALLGLVPGLGNIADVGAPVSLADITLFQKRIQGSLFGASNPKSDILTMLRLYMDGRLKLDELVTKRYTLDQINEGYTDMREGRNIRGIIEFS